MTRFRVIAGGGGIAGLAGRVPAEVALAGAAAAVSGIAAAAAALDGLVGGSYGWASGMTGAAAIAGG